MATSTFHFVFQRTLASLMFILILIRIYIRFYLPHRERRWWGFLSEVFVIIAWVCYTIPVCVDATNIWDKADNKSLIWLGKWVYWWWIEYVVIYYSIKASMLIFYNEWIPRTLKKCWWTNRILMGICFVLFIISAGLYAFWCWPISSNWNITDPNACWSGQSDPAFFCRFAFHLFTDILIFTLPIFVIRQMTGLTFRKKLEASAMFLLGFFNIVCAVLVFAGSMKGLPEAVIFVFQNLDQSVGVLVVCAPALKAFVFRCWHFWSDRIPLGQKRRRSQRLGDLDLENDTVNTDSVGLSKITKSQSSAGGGKRGQDSGFTSIDESSVPRPIMRGERILPDQHISLDAAVAQNSTVGSTTLGSYH